MAGLKTSYRGKGQRVNKQQMEEVQRLASLGKESRQIAIDLGLSEFFVWRIRHHDIPYYLCGRKRYLNDCPARHGKSA